MFVDEDQYAVAQGAVCGTSCFLLGEQHFRIVFIFVLSLMRVACASLSVLIGWFTFRAPIRAHCETVGGVSCF